MPLATLQFNLPEEQDEFRTAVKGSKYKAALCDLDEALRTLVKHGSEEAQRAMTPDKVRARLWEILAENDADDILE
jgi:hypothetical protein